MHIFEGRVRLLITPKDCTELGLGNLRYEFPLPSVALVKPPPRKLVFDPTVAYHLLLLVL